MLHFQDNEEYKLKRIELFFLNGIIPNWRQHFNNVIPFNKKDFINFLKFFKEEENIEQSRTLLKICEYFDVNQEDLDEIKSKLPNLFINFWENVEQILELDFEEIKNSLENIDIPKEKIKDYIEFINRAVFYKFMPFFKEIWC